MESIFKQRFLKHLFLSMQAHPENNWDFHRFSKDHPRRAKLQIEDASRCLDFIFRHAASFETAYRLFQDKASQDLMITLLVYRVLDHHHVKLPLNTPDYWKSIEMVNDVFLKARRVVKSDVWNLNEYYLPGMGLTVFCRPRTIMTTFLLKQYYHLGPPAIAPQAGDIVIDGGACWGDTALHFAHTVGRTGQVHSFEFVPANIAILKKHLAVNPGMEGTIVLAPYALSDVSNQELRFDDYGPASCISDNGRQSVKTSSLDDYVHLRQLDRVDFIKMDIEGSEKPALQGAREVIRKYRPKLAISAYHRLGDLYELPLAIRAIDPGYHFYLGHYTIHSEETILYAVHPASGAENRQSGPKPV